MLKRLLLSLSIFIFVVYLLSLIISEDIYIERTKLINAPADAVFQQIADMDKWKQWNTFSSVNREEKLKVDYTRDDADIIVEMNSKDGKGNNISVRFGEVIENQKVETFFFYVIDKQEVKSISTFYLSDTDPSQTTVRWLYQGNYGPIVGSFLPFRVFLLISKYLLRSQMDKSLDKLNDLLTKEPSPTVDK